MDRVKLKEWLYRIADDLHDGPDAHLTLPLKSFADDFTKPDEPLAEEASVVVNPNPQPFGGQPEQLPQVTEPTPESPPFTPAQLEALKKLLGV